MRTVLKSLLLILILANALAEEGKVVEVSWGKLFFSQTLKEQNEHAESTLPNLSYQGLVTDQNKKVTYWINHQMYLALPKGFVSRKERLFFKEGDKYIPLLVGETYDRANKKVLPLLEKGE